MIGTLRLEHKKPQQVPLDSEIHFGASTRRYVIRERPQTQATSGAAGGEDREEIEGGLLGLPETETELDVSEKGVGVGEEEKRERGFVGQAGRGGGGREGGWERKKGGRGGEERATGAAGDRDRAGCECWRRRGGRAAGATRDRQREGRE